MRRFKLIGITVAALTAAALLVHCSEKDKGTTPAETVVQMNGVLTFPDPAGITMSQIQVGFGANDVKADSNGAFKINGNTHVPGVATAYDQDTVPLLISICPDPQKNIQLQLDVHSTTIALVFMSPHVCVSRRDDAVAVLNRLETLPEISTLESLLRQKMTANPRCLAAEDAQIAQAVVNAVVAFVNSYFPTAGSPEGRDNGNKSMMLGETSSGYSVGIIPTTQTSGHLLSYKGGSSFEITNAYGRFAICVAETASQAPTQMLLLWPNGNMFDFFKNSSHLPWAPSVKPLQIHLGNPNDTLYVKVYGPGFKDDPDNVMANLTADEKRLVWYALVGTTLEFCHNLFSVLTNSGNMVIEGNTCWGYSLKSTQYEKVVSFLFDDAIFVAKIEALCEEKRYGDIAWEVSKRIMRKVISSPQYRAVWMEIAGYTFTDATLAKLDKYSVLQYSSAIATGGLIGERLTSAAKAAWGVQLASLKTTFRVWKIVSDFGGITGHVMQNESPYGAVVGAHVHLSGDDANPIPGHVTDVTTDGTGGFTFENVMVGDKSLAVTKAGYNDKSVSVTVTKDQVAEVTIKLSKRVGTVKGNVINDIYVKARQLPEYATHDTLFDGQLYVYARGRVADQPYEDSRSISNGHYTFDLPAGTFWIVATSPDNAYLPDSLQVNIVENQTTNAFRNLRMKPNCRVTASVTPGSTSSYNLVFDSANASQPMHDGSQNAIVFSGFTPGQTADEFDFWINENVVYTDSMYDAGTMWAFTQNNPKVGGFAAYGSNHHLRCQHDGQTYDFILHVIGDPDESGCDCGISTVAELGNIRLSKYGNELGDVLEGNVDCTLAYWRNCECTGTDTNHDGKNDQWNVVCEKVRFNVDFKVLVGSKFYQKLQSPVVGAANRGVVNLPMNR